jgi:hypothetical protein
MEVAAWSGSESEKGSGCEVASVASMSSSGSPLRSRCSFSFQLLRRAPRLVNTAMTCGVSTRTSRSACSPTSASGTAAAASGAGAAEGADSCRAAGVAGVPGVPGASPATVAGFGVGLPKKAWYP